MVNIEQAHSKILQLFTLQVLNKMPIQQLVIDTRELLDQLVEHATLAERERSAQVAAESYDAGTGYALEVANKIRSGN